MSRQVALLGTQLVPETQAVTHVRDQGLNWGASVFDGVRAYWNENHEQLYVAR
jgi:branched-chain amino acid aminotransferase